VTAGLAVGLAMLQDRSSNMPDVVCGKATRLQCTIALWYNVR